MMTDIKWYWENGVCGLVAEGHAAYEPGNDIVCSAISALVQTLYAGLEMRCYASVTRQQESGWFDINVAVTEKNRERVKVLFDSVVFGLELIAREYPENVKIARVKGQ